MAMMVLTDCDREPIRISGLVPFFFSKLAVDGGGSVARVADNPVRRIGFALVVPGARASNALVPAE